LCLNEMFFLIIEVTWTCALTPRGRRNLLLLLLLLSLLLPLGSQDIIETLVSLQFLNLRESVGLLGKGNSPTQGRYLTKTQTNHKHQCLE
jgi:hypothetical protein